MNKLYVVVAGYVYESDVIMGIFDTEEAAEELKKKIRVNEVDIPYFDYVNIQIFQLNKTDLRMSYYVNS